MNKVIECVPNFSEGRDLAIIRQITDSIESVQGVQLLDVDPGESTNRTVVTFIGEPGPVKEAAFRAVQKAAELIDMSGHEGEHARFGATDVCPFVPVAGAIKLMPGTASNPAYRNIDVDVETGGEITVSGRKLLDICRALPDGANVAVSVSGEKLHVRSGRSKFALATLPAAEFPSVEDVKASQTISVAQEVLGRLIEKTHFSMAQQDVRYYLNGMLLESGGSHLRTVATDGHRLALCQAELDGAKLDEQQVIVPRKGVLELQRLLSGEGSVDIVLGANHIQIELDGIRFTSKLIDGRFPDYDRVIPKPDGNKLRAEMVQREVDHLLWAAKVSELINNDEVAGCVSSFPDRLRGVAGADECRDGV